MKSIGELLFQVLPSGEYPTAINRCRWSEDIKKAIFPSQEIKGNNIMKTKTELVIEWCKKNKIVDLITCYMGGIYHYKYTDGTTDEDAKLVIGGFDDKRNYYKLPADIFKVKVSKKKKEIK